MAEENGHQSQVQDALVYGVTQFDKAILFIASGAFAISFVFIKDVVPVDLRLAYKQGFLLASWYCFGTVVFLSLVTHYLTSLGAAWALKNESLEPKDFNRKVKYWNIPIRILNITMIALILVGAILLIYFIQKNIITK